MAAPTPLAWGGKRFERRLRARQRRVDGSEAVLPDHQPMRGDGQMNRLSGTLLPFRPAAAG